jgi:hypothetical protein
MLDVSLNLVAVVAMLFGIVVPGLHIEVDGLNSPTAKPILGGWHKMGTDSVGFKASRDTRGRNSSRILPYHRAMVKAYRSWSRERAGEAPPLSFGPHSRDARLWCADVYGGQGRR